MMASEIQRPVSPTIRLTVWTLIVTVVISIIGSFLAKTEIVARGQGKIIPASRVQIVQPQIDGKIVNILVSEGQSVDSGQLLIRMDTSLAESEIGRIKASITRYMVDAAVAHAIINALGRYDPIDEKFVSAGAHSLRRQLASLDTQHTGADTLVGSVLNALRDQIAETDARRNRVIQNQSVQKARFEKARSDREIVMQRFASARELKERGTISNFDYLDRLRELNAIDGEVLVAHRELDGFSAEAETLIKQRSSIISAAISTYQKQLNEADIVLPGLRSELNAAQTRLENLTIESPAKGRIENLQTHTVGGFTEAGSPLMSIVPSNRDIEIEAFFDNRDVGFLKEGQRAFIKFDAFPAERFGIVRGHVTGIGADARSSSAPDKWVYAVRLKIEQNSIKVNDSDINFTPGMTATIDVITGERRFISYFFEPVLKVIQDGFGER